MAAISFAIIRVLGNDIPTRHDPNQTYTNLDYILSREENFADTTKIFCLNRIVDPDMLTKLKDRLDQAGVQYWEIPFDKEHYATLRTDDKRKHYLTNVNPARNMCLDMPAIRADYRVLLDGSVFLTQDGWFQIEDMVYQHRNQEVMGCAVCRVDSIEELESPKFVPNIKEAYGWGNSQVVSSREPYLIFKDGCEDRFDESLTYGKADKAELLYRLGVPGFWDRWEPLLRSEALRKPSPNFGTVTLGGYAVRLPSYTHGGGGGNNRQRGADRKKGLQLFVESLR